MKVTSLKYLLKEGARNLWTNRVLSITSVGILTTCLLIVGAAYLLTINVDSMVRYVEGQNEMSVFLEEGADDATIEAVGDTLRQNTNVANVRFISKEEGLEDLKTQFGDDAYLVDGLKDRNPVPDTYVVSLKDVSMTEQMQAEFSGLAGVEIVTASVEVADTFTNLQWLVNVVGGAIIIALCVISLVIIANTIRATIFMRRKEINIMKFVGATNGFIRIPFLVEGFLLGLISALVSFLIIWGTYSYLLQSMTGGGSAFLASMFTSLIPFKDVALRLGLFFFLSGTLIGMFGSAISIRNHVKV
jgi:cell division transport system permease protein